MQARADGRRRRRALTVRVRILAAVLGLATLGLTVAGGTAFWLQRERVDLMIDDALARNFEEFEALAADGVDPETGAGFTSVRSLLYVAMQRTVPAPNEGMFAVVGGRVELEAAPPVRIRLEDVTPAVDAALAAQGTDRVVLRSLRDGERSYRIVVIPVRVTGDAQDGVLVYGFDRTAEHAELIRAYRTFAVVGAVALLVLGAVAWVVAGRLLSPLRSLRETAQRITDTDLSERIDVRGEDDVSDLARTVNSMLDRLESAFTSQRRLLDDAGHELRTPLTIVRGHLELMDPGDPDDVRSTQDLVIDELDRMHRLVDDLMTLATADRPDFVRSSPVDVGRLTDDVLDKARTLGPRRWLVEHRADVVAPVDEQRLTQAWLQLAANAVKFSPEGSAVRIGSRVEHGHLQLTVHDEGSGLSASDAERVFGRFVRGTAGRGVEGSGLGLPIVRAIAVAHGGWAHADTSAPRGARFVIEIPLVETLVDGEGTTSGDDGDDVPDETLVVADDPVPVTTGPLPAQPPVVPPTDPSPRPGGQP